MERAYRHFCALQSVFFTHLKIGAIQIFFEIILHMHTMAQEGEGGGGMCLPLPPTFESWGKHVIFPHTPPIWNMKPLKRRIEE